MLISAVFNLDRSRPVARFRLGSPLVRVLDTDSYQSVPAHPHDGSRVRR